MHYDDRMPSLQIRDMPEEVYEALGERAQAERRSLAQQAVVELSAADDSNRGQRRRLAVSRLKAQHGGNRPRPPRRDPVRLVREDRKR